MLRDVIFLGIAVLKNETSEKKNVSSNKMTIPKLPESSFQIVIGFVHHGASIIVSNNKSEPHEKKQSFSSTYN